MIGNVTSSTQAVPTTSASSSSSTSQDSNVSTVLMPFGQLFVENLNSGDPTVVGFDYGHGYQGSSAGSASSSVSPPFSSNAVSATSDSPLDTTVSSSASSSSTDSIVTGVDSDDPTYVPTAQSVFGDSPWESDAGGTGPAGPFALNPEYFATQATAQKVAGMVGGTVVGINLMAEAPGNPFTQNEDNEMVQLADGSQINAGLVAGFFTHGYQLSMVSQMIQNEVTNVEAETQGVSTT
jgi:hypothetical protein